MHNGYAVENGVILFSRINILYILKHVLLDLELAGFEPGYSGSQFAFYHLSYSVSVVIILERYFAKLGHIGKYKKTCSCTCHVLDRKVVGSNLAAVKNLFQFKSTKNIFAEVRGEEKGNTLTHHISQSSSSRSRRGDKKRKRKEVEASFEASILCGGAI